MAQALMVKRITRFDGGGSTKAFADLAIGEEFLVKGLRVINGKNGLFVSMPRQQRQGKWTDTVETLTKDTKTTVERLVLDAYQQNPAQ
ncbi:MAG: septation protein SpoVG family protein [Candidatus Omnitrophica bacterium]|nr:septation protein SpoVG family protein [Candidatus Omnitrophota bacterium]